MRVALLCLLCVACDDETVGAAVGTDGGAPLQDAQIMVDREPAWDARPDGPAPDAARVGPQVVTLEPGALTLIEGQPARSVVVLMHGELPSTVRVDLSTDIGTVEPTTVSFDPTGERSATIRLKAPFDADDEDTHGTLVATMPGGEAQATITVVDVHNTFEFVLDEDQLNFVLTSRDKERRLQVGTRINGKDGPRAEINLRGKGTLNCHRRSFTVRFDQPAYIRNSPPMEHLLLLSMCLDTTYMKMRSSFEVLQAQGLFPAWFGYTELRYGDGSRGVYLMVERPRKAIPRVHPANKIVIRRIRDNREEIKRPTAETIADVDAFLAPYRRLYELRSEFDGEALLSQLRRHIDYDLYLRWLAINSVLRNGDYIDEVYFYDRAVPDGAVSPFFAVMAWDYDDVLKGCHTRGPLPEPLFYCAESSLDRPVMNHPVIRQVYVDILRDVMTGPLTVARYETLVQRVAAEFEVYLDRPGVVDAMRPDRDDRSPPPEPGAAARAMLDTMSARYGVLEDLLP